MIRANTVITAAGSLRRTLSGTFVATSLLLTACGGGGGGGDSSPLASRTPPVASSGVVFTFVDRPVSDTLIASDPDGNPLTYDIVTNGQLGSATITNVNNGNYTYTPNPGTSGTDTFTFKVNNGTYDSNISVITVHIKIDGPPIANSDAYSADEGATLSVNKAKGVLANDLDAENQPLTAVLVDNVKNGSLILNADGSFIYSHNGGETTSDSFTYRATDGTSNSDVATVSIIVNPVNDPPVANSESYNVDEGASLVVNRMLGVLANDTDIDSANLTAVLVSNVEHGVLVLSNDGSFFYAHDGSETVVDSFTYTANDGVADSAPTTVTITINPVNDPPTGGDDTGATDEDTVLNATAPGVLANDSDAEGDPFTITGFDATSSKGALVNVNNDGSYSYDPRDSADLQALSAGEQTTDTFTYTLSDGNDSSTATVTITLTGINDAPVAMAGCGTTRQEQNFAGTLAGDDIETPGLLMFSLGIDGSGGAGPLSTTKGQVTITNTTTGEYSYVPDNPGARGVDTFTYRVEDPDGGFATATETVIIDKRIMPLGDSIIRGGTGGGFPADDHKIGFRKPLYDGLVTAGYSFDFVGTMQDGNNPIYQPFDFDGEGHGGWRDNEIAWGQVGYPTDGVRAWLDMNPADIVLLHIGTNGLDTNAADVESILDEIDVWENNPGGNPVTVLLARITDWNPINPDVTTFNDNVEAMALDRVNNPLNPAYPDDIIIVDQQGALIYPDDLNDQVHPNQTGYDKMAVVWQQDLEGSLDKCP